MTDANGKSVKRKQTVLRTRKSIGMGKGSDSDDDFRPIKAAALKRKPTEKKAAPQKAKDKEDVKVRAAESSVPKRKTAQKIMDDEDEDEDEDMYVAPPPKIKRAAESSVPKRKTAKKIVDDEDEDEDEDMYVAPPPETKADVRKKAPAPASDRDSGEEKPSKIKGKAKGKAKVSPKRKR